MKSILIFIFCTALNISSFASSNTAKLNEAASALYTEGKYAEALGIWYGLAASGNTDANLFFDIGNAESILGHIPEAILAYERAAKWRPGDRTIQEAIKKERVKIENAVIPVNSFFLIDWYDNIMAMFRPGEWVWLALLLLGMGIMQWLVKMEAIRKIGWINGRNPLYFIGTGMLLLIIGVLSYNQ
ncbi:MAG: hypothetical protein ABIQ02_14745, partial [Saprospiraceae bacterium]